MLASSVALLGTALTRFHLSVATSSDVDFPSPSGLFHIQHPQRLLWSSEQSLSHKTAEDSQKLLVSSEHISLQTGAPLALVWNID